MEAAKDYIFISYSRDDSAKVIPIVDEMQDSGYNVWYDKKIPVGKNWLNSLASHIKRCTVFVAFHSQTSRDSQRCQEEIHYALKKEKPVLSVYLEDVTLEDGLDMQLARFHSVTYAKYVEYAEPAELLEALRESSDFERCHPGAPKKREGVNIKKIGAALKRRAQSLLRTVSFLVAVSLLVAMLAAFVFYRNHTFLLPRDGGGAAVVFHKNQTPLWLFDEGGVLDIISLPFSEDYSYELDDYRPPPWNAKTRLVQCAMIRKGITRIGASFFQDCSNMKFVFIPESVTSIGNHAFFGCVGLKELEIPNGVTDIGQWAFSGCSRLKSVSFPSSITDINAYVFSDCRTLERVQFHEGIQVIHAWAFANCTALEEITIPYSIDNSCRIWPYAFLGCSNLKTVRIQSAPERVQIVQEKDWFKKPISDLPTLYICATAFDSNPEIIYEPPVSDTDVSENDYEGGIFHENQQFPVRDVA